MDLCDDEDTDVTRTFLFLAFSFLLADAERFARNLTRERLNGAEELIVWLDRERKFERINCMGAYTKKSRKFNRQKYNLLSIAILYEIFITNVRAMFDQEHHLMNGSTFNDREEDSSV